ncbi:MAG: hypothetical protein IJR90_05450 [Clostridia bacterium]|nr:hypothetical protein [Clostridia bacterium]
METQNPTRNKPLKMHLLELTSMLVRVKRTRLLLPNETYNETLDSQLMTAIKRCEKNETSLISIKYPIVDHSMIHGLMGLKSYMLNLYYENVFCGEYDKEELKWLYENYCKKFEKDASQSVFNIYSAVYLNALFCDYLKKDYGTLRLTEDDCKLAQSLLGSLTDDDRYDIMYGCAKHFTYGSIAYNNKTFDKLFTGILSAIKHKNIGKILVSE